MNQITIFTLIKNKIKDFALERNRLLKSSKTDWVLFLDLDEKLDNTHQNTRLPLRQLTDRNDTNYESYYLIRKNYFLGKYVGTDKIIRLVKKGTGKFVRKVHEIWKPQKSHLVGVIKNTFIIHNTADNLTDFINKIDFYSTLHAAENLTENKKSSLFKIIIYPLGNFVVHLFKSKNIVFSIMKSLHSYLAWTKMYFRTEQK